LRSRKARQPVSGRHLSCGFYFRAHPAAYAAGPGYPLQFLDPRPTHGPIPYTYRRTGENPGKMLVESASAIYDTLQQGIPNIFPVSSPALRRLYGRVAPKGGDMGWVNGRGSAVFPLLSLARAKAKGFRLSKMGSRGAYGDYTALLSQAASLYWVLELLLCAGRDCILSTTPFNRALSLRPMPFLSCKFFSPQKTYGTFTAGFHAGGFRLRKSPSPAILAPEPARHPWRRPPAQTYSYLMPEHRSQRGDDSPMCVPQGRGKARKNIWNSRP
jgi:hypothetical protein